MNLLKKTFLVFGVFWIFLLESVAQSGLCTPDVPFYKVDITSDPAGLWQSDPPIVRRGDCCGSSWPDRCIEFEILLHSDAVAINFEILSGAVPGGAMFYQIGCGPLTKVGDPICVDGPGPHVLTFCKPGSNLNTYGITSIPGPTGSPDTKTSEGCTTTLSATGLTNIVWTDITSNDGRYESYLSCITADCDSVLVTPQTGYPSFVDYQVCGEPTLGPCYPFPQFCDTVRVNFVPPLNDSIYPNPAVYCETESGIVITGGISGGEAPYTFIWTDASGQFLSNDSGYFAAEGSYNLEIRDALYPNCPAKYLSGNVSKELSPTVATSPDLTICANFPTANISGTVSNSNSYFWHGAGTFGSSFNTLTNTYTPTGTEIIAGYAEIYLTAVPIGVCEIVTDTLRISINPALTVAITAPSYVCFGEKAKLTANISGGTTPYNILWNTGEKSAVITNQDPGNFSVTVTDSSGTTCTASDAATINENPEIIVTVPNLTTIICDSSALVTAVASGGSGHPYNYLWSNGRTDSTEVLFVGNYTITASDWTGCSKTEAVAVQAVNSNLNVDFPVIPNLCYGTTMSLNPTVNNGFQPYNYLWDNGESASKVSASAGIHCVTITDSAGCIRTACVELNEDSILNVAIQGSTTVCAESASSVAAIVSGGSYPYSYLWSTTSTDSTETLTKGTYVLTVTDNNANACDTSVSITIVDAPELIVSLTQDSVTCYGSATGKAISAINGGTSPYTYSWSNGNSLPNLNGNSSGQYILTVTDSLSCVDADTVTILEPDSMSAIIKSFVEPLCYSDANGRASVNTVGGTPPFTFVWIPSSEIDSNAIALSAGLTTVIVTDAKGCVDSAVFTLTEPLPLNLSLSSTNVSCKNGNNGTASPIVTGGSTPYSFSWSHNASSDSTATNLSVGNYMVTITDKFACSISDSMSITEPDSLIGTISGVTDALCQGTSDGQAIISATGGVSPYQYLWSNSITTPVNASLDSGWHEVSITDSLNCVYLDSIYIDDPSQLTLIGSPPGPINCDSSLNIFVGGQGGTAPYTYQWGTGETTDTITVNSTGNFYVTVTDSNGCVADTTVNVYPLTSTLELIIQGTTNVCFGELSSLSPIITPGVAPYSFSWVNGKVDSVVQESTGLHCLTITDNVGCKASDCFEVEEHPLLNISTISDTICIGSQGTVSSTVTGGLSPYYFSWSNGDATKDITDYKGTYYLTVSDSINCSITDSANVVELLPLEMTFPKFSSETCLGANDGWVSSSISGGLQPFSYYWSTGDTSSTITGISSGFFALTVTDAVGCVITDSIYISGPIDDLTVNLFSSNVTCNNQNDGKTEANIQGGMLPYKYLWWETNDTVNSINSLSPGSYTFSVVDSAGCIKTDSIIISEPDILIGTIESFTDVLCYGDPTGTANVAVTGGTAPFSILWNNGSSSFNPRNLAGGTNTFTVRDKNSCMHEDSVIVNEPSSIITTVSSDAYIKCDSTAVVFVQATGGVGNFEYLWATGETTDSVPVTGSGNYIVTVTDSNGCSAIDTAFVYPILSMLSVELIGPNKICVGDSVLLTVNVTPGIEPITFEWNDGSTDSTFMSFGGNQCVTATDSVQCQHTDCIDVSLTPPLAVELGNDSVCHNDTGTLVAKISGGQSPFDILWNNGSKNDTIQSTGGQYTVTVTDGIGCVEVDSALIWENDSIAIATTVTHNLCKDQTLGEISAALSGGTSPLIVAWSGTLSTDTVIKNLSGGNYQITVTDKQNCESIKSITVNEPDSALSLALTGSNPQCYGDCNGVITSTALGGTRPYSYVWSNSSSEANNTNLCAGIYNLAITDSNGCTVYENNFELNQPEEVEIVYAIKSNSSCHNVCDGSLSVASNNASLYSIDGGISFDSDSVFNTLCPAEYSVFIKDNNECLDSVKVEIGNPTDISIAGPNDTLVCYGSTVDLASYAFGGTGNKSYYWNNELSSNKVSVKIYKDTILTFYAADANGCRSKLDSVFITVRSPLVVTSSPDTALCIGESLFLYTEVSGGDGNNYTYQWIDGVENLIGTNDFIQITPTITSNYIVKVTDMCGTQPVFDTINVKVEGGSNFNVSYELSPVCLPALATFSPIGLDSTSTYTYTWIIDSLAYSSSENPAVEILESGYYDVSLMVESSDGCSFRIDKPDFVKLDPNPIANFSADPIKSTIENPIFQFTDESTGADKISWNLDYKGRSIATNPYAFFDSIACFPIFLKAENKTGCVDSITKEICVEDIYRFFAPNAFSPNDDGINDQFVTKWHLLDISEFEFLIFDRWGLLIFQTNDPYEFWDGKIQGKTHLVQQDVYVWKAKTKDTYGTDYSYIGTVTVIR